MRDISFALILGLAAAGAQTPPQPSATATVSGTVRDAGTGEPIPDAGIFATNPPARPVAAEVDSEGRYTLRGLTPGQIRITAQARLQFGPPLSTTKVITVSAGQELTSIDFQLRPNAEISGKVIDQNSEPVPGIGVFLVAREYSYGTLRYVYAGGARTDDLGQYLLGNVGTGRAYLLVAQNRPEQLPALSPEPPNPHLRKPAFLPTYYPGTPSPEGGQLLTLRSGERRENMDIQVQRSASYCLQGEVNAGGADGVRFSIEESWPASGANGSGSMFVSAPGGVTGPDRKIRICGLHSGEYRLTVHSEMRAPDFFGTAMVVIADKDENQIVVVASPRIAVPGQVDWDGAPPEPPVTSNLLIDVRPIARALFSVELDSPRSPIPGKFSFEGLFMDDYAAEIRNVPAGAYLKDVTYGDRSVLYEPLRPGTATGEAALRVILARDGGKISTKVADKDGNPVADANVVILPESAASEAVLAAQMVSGQADQNGAWSSSQLAPGKYYVLATQAPVLKSPEIVNKLWLARSKAKEVDLAPGATSQVTLPPLD